jgi:hypothetical protein
MRKMSSAPKSVDTATVDLRQELRSLTDRQADHAPGICKFRHKQARTVTVQRRGIARVLHPAVLLPLMPANLASGDERHNCP